MRIVVSKAETEFSSLVRALEQDPSSWQGWLCVHMRIETKRDYHSYLSPMGLVISEMGQYLQDVDGTAYVIGSHHLFIVCRHISKHDIRSIATDISYNILANHSITSNHRLYELEYDWVRLGRWCDDLGCWKFSDHDLNSTSPDLATLSGMDDIDYIFEQNSKGRSKRVPTTIMLVEDDLLTCRMVSRILKDDYRLITAHNAHEAAAQYVTHAPDMVFLDIGLPDHNGFSVMQAIRDIDPEAFCVMFSSNSFAENISRSIHAGARGFVEKPFRKERLDHYIHAFNQYSQSLDYLRNNPL